MEVALAYDHRTSLVATAQGAAFDLAANLRRSLVAFQGRVKEPLLFRQLMIALHQCIVSDLRWGDEDMWYRMLDPVITVHHDQIFFEAFSNDQSSYARLSAPLSAFEPEGAISYGTTNIDFTWELRAAMQKLRSSRRTDFRVGAGGFGVTTQVGAATKTHFERKVDLPESWLKGFLQVQSALVMHPYFFEARPVDLLTVLAYTQDHKPPTPPHGLRYEFRPDEPISVVLEPWEQRFSLRGTRYSGYERVVRLWGRRRLELLQGVLPYADRVQVGVLGRGLPHFYTCSCGPYQFTLVLSGWTKNDWSRDSAFDLLAQRSIPDASRVARVYAYLREHLAAPQADIAANMGWPGQEVEAALFSLCRGGRVMFDPTTRQYRLRELFAEPIDADTLFAPDPRIAIAQKLYEDGRVTLRHITLPAPEETRRRETRATATVNDAEAYEVTVSVDDTGRVRFGRCTCPFFADNLMSRGPCEHILAARVALEAATAKEAQQADTAPSIAEF
jgi:predicted nucleic acid-binding Zn finger protein